MPPLPPRVNLSGEQYCYIEDKFVHTGPTTEPNTICSYVLNALDEKVPHVDLGGEMKEVPDNVQGMRTQFERVMQKMKEALVAKRNARRMMTIALLLISQMKKRSKKSVLARYLAAIP
jgi:hypothetical protein